MNEIPRRMQVEKMVPAERAILVASEYVEGLGADLRLTEAVNFLTAARTKVADYIDEKLEEKLPPKTFTVFWLDPDNVVHGTQVEAPTANLATKAVVPKISYGGEDSIVAVFEGVVKDARR